jgi:uncharacterized membrane protein
MQQQDEDFVARLAVEVGAWQREGLVSENTAERILARYHAGTGAARAARLGPVTTFLGIIGAVVLGAGVVLFFAANWDVLPAWFKLGLIFVGLALAYGAGAWFRYGRGNLPRLGAGLIFLGALLFQAGIFLLEQIYNMPLDNPAALALGAAGILVLAYAVGLRAVLLVGLLDALAWIGWELLKRYPEFPEQLVAPLAYLLIGALVFAAATLHRVWGDRLRFGAVYEVVGLLTVLAPVYFFTFGFLWEEVQRRPEQVPRAPLWVFGLVAVTLLVLIATALWRRSRLGWIEAAAFGAVALLAGVVAFAPTLTSAYALLFNVAFFGLALLACVRGYLQGEARFVNTGIPLLALGLVTRYIDVFWELLPRSAFYIVGGIVLLAVAGGLEKLRQRLLRGPVDADAEGGAGGPVPAGGQP